MDSECHGWPDDERMNNSENPYHCKAALIGNRGHHVYVLEETDVMPDLSIVGIAPGFEGEDLSSLETRYGQTATTYADHLTMLAEAKPDVLIISTRLDRIADLAIDAAQAGCNTLCEKPLALTRRNLERLWCAVVAYRTQCLAMLPSRNGPVLAVKNGGVVSGEITPEQIMAGVQVIKAVAEAEKTGNSVEILSIGNCK
jgi:(2Fe-2S) ferredoxin